MSAHITVEIEFNLLPTILKNIPDVVAKRLENAANDAREVGRSGVDDPGLPQSDTGALREGIVVQTEDGDDFDERRSAALSAFTGNASRFGAKGHTEADFNRLCAELPPLPQRENPFELVATIVVLMKYGLWFEDGSAWDLAAKAKRSPSPWLGPAMSGFEQTGFENHFGGVIEEAAL